METEHSSRYWAEDFKSCLSYNVVDSIIAAIASALVYIQHYRDKIQVLGFGSPCFTVKFARSMPRRFNIFRKTPLYTKPIGQHVRIFRRPKHARAFTSPFHSANVQSVRISMNDCTGHENNLSSSSSRQVNNILAAVITTAVYLGFVRKQIYGFSDKAIYKSNLSSHCPDRCPSEEAVLNGLLFVKNGRHFREFPTLKYDLQLSNWSLFTTWPGSLMGWVKLYILKYALTFS